MYSTKEIVKYLRKKLEERGCRLPSKMVPDLVIKKYRNRDIIKTMPKADIEKNLDVLAKDIEGILRKRLERSFRPGVSAVSKRDLEGALSEQFCKLPPFCRHL